MRAIPNRCPHPYPIPGPVTYPIWIRPDNPFSGVNRLEPTSVWHPARYGSRLACRFKQNPNEFNRCAVLYVRPRSR
jgi:hypothetical protein